MIGHDPLSSSFGNFGGGGVRQDLRPHAVAPHPDPLSISMANQLDSMRHAAELLQTNPQIDRQPGMIFTLLTHRGQVPTPTKLTPRWSQPQSPQYNTAFRSCPTAAALAVRAHRAARSANLHVLRCSHRGATGTRCPPSHLHARFPPDRLALRRRSRYNTQHVKPLQLPLRGSVQQRFIAHRSEDSATTK